MAGSPLLADIRSILDRRREARINEQLGAAGYLDNPEQALQTFGKQNPKETLMTAKMLQDLHTQQSATQDATADHTGKFFNALNSVVAGGGDLNSAFDALAGNYGISGPKAAEMKATIAANPHLLDAFVPDANKVYQSGPGGELITRSGVVLHSTPFAPQKGVVLPQGSMYLPPDVAGVSGGAAAPAAPVTPVGTSRGVRNNNAGNIKDGPFARSQPGYAGTDGTFAKFSNPEFGVRAQESLLQGPRYFGGGNNTVNSIIDTYLGKGAAENSVASRANYKAYVAQRLGVDPNVPLPPQTVRPLAAAMREFETGNRSGGGAAVGGGGAGGGIITNPKPAPGKVRAATPQEITAAGYPAGTAAQVDANGKFLNIKTPAAGARGGKNDPVKLAAQADDSIRSLQAIVTRATQLQRNPNLAGAVGSIQGRIPSVFQSTRDVDADFEDLKNKIALGTMAKLKSLSASGATGFGNLSDKEGARLAGALGNLDQTQGTSQIRGRLAEVIESAQDAIRAIKAGKSQLAPQAAGWKIQEVK